jgi:hypothetical protein
LEAAEERHTRHGLLLDTEAFNKELMLWLLWYDTKRVNHPFKNRLSSVQYLMRN